MVSAPRTSSRGSCREAIARAVCRPAVPPRVRGGVDPGPAGDRRGRDAPGDRPIRGDAVV
ncbi:hypothetical protein [Gordonia phage GTE5]|uniref:Uncharacterized protein n=1 Tax=Gordonia phage GTE5 TaxID=319522 RepID=G8EJV9_9CAUD|nr:hypothetical protein GoPhGTE5p92 [Gordonia phage GTE5]AET09841.1 hypothetical protein [Gordonia phage GTE5]